MNTPLVTTEHYREDGTWRGWARCRAGHRFELPDLDFGDWCNGHADCEPGDGQAELVSVPRPVLNDLIKVAAYVSIGRRGVDHQPDGAPYPDSTARFALGALTELGLRREAGR